MWRHLNENPVILGHMEEDLPVVEFNFATDLLSNTTHQPVKQTNYRNKIDVYKQLNYCKTIPSLFSGVMKHATIDMCTSDMGSVFFLVQLFEFDLKESKLYVNASAAEIGTQKVRV